MTPANKTVEIIPGKGKNLFPEKLKDEFYYKAMILAKIMSENEYAAPVRLHDPREIFREYAQRVFKPEPPELVDAQQRLTAALEEAALTAEVLGNQLRRYNNRMRANKWHGRSWGRKGW